MGKRFPIHISCVSARPLPEIRDPRLLPTCGEVARRAGGGARSQYPLAPFPRLRRVLPHKWGRDSRSTSLAYPLARFPRFVIHVSSPLVGRWPEGPEGVHGLSIRSPPSPGFAGYFPINGEEIPDPHLLRIRCAA